MTFYRTCVTLGVWIRRLRNAVIKPRRIERMLCEQFFKFVACIVRAERARHPVPRSSGKIAWIGPANEVIVDIFGEHVLIGEACLEFALFVEELPRPRATVIRRKSEKVIHLLLRALSVERSGFTCSQPDENLKRDVSVPVLHELRDKSKDILLGVYARHTIALLQPGGIVLRLFGQWIRLGIGLTAKLDQFKPFYHMLELRLVAIASLIRITGKRRLRLRSEFKITGRTNRGFFWTTRILGRPY